MCVSIAFSRRTPLPPIKRVVKKAVVDAATGTVNATFDNVATEISVGNTNFDNAATEIPVGNTNFDNAATEIPVGNTTFDNAATEIHVGNTTLENAATEIDVVDIKDKPTDDADNVIISEKDDKVVTEVFVDEDDEYFNADSEDEEGNIALLISF